MSSLLYELIFEYEKIWNRKKNQQRIDNSMLNQRQFTFLEKFDFEHLVIWFHLNCENRSLMRAIKSNEFKVPSFNSRIFFPIVIWYNFGMESIEGKCVVVNQKSFFQKHTSNRFRPEFVMVFLVVIYLMNDIQLSALGFVLSPLCPATVVVVGVLFVVCAVVVVVFSTAFELPYFSVKFSSFRLVVCLPREIRFFFFFFFVFAFFFNNRFLLLTPFNAQSHSP